MQNQNENKLFVKENTDASGFVLVSDVIPDAILDIRYYSTYNFMGERIDGYEEPVALLTREAADALKAVSDEAIKNGYRLKIFDCYRPQCAVDHFVRWANKCRAVEMKRYFYPEVDKRNLFELGFVAQKSGHSRGSTVDLTLFDMATQKDLDVGGTFDYFGHLSWAEYSENITEQQAANRKYLRELMMKCGFRPLAEEWWHFTLENEPYPDTYFTFPVNSNQVRKKSDFSKRLESDMEFRFRFYDAVSRASFGSRQLLEEAIQKAFMLTASELEDFSRRENIAFNEARIKDAVNQLNHAVNEAVLKLFE